jgi:hypothetical protein
MEDICVQFGGDSGGVSLFIAALEDWQELAGGLLGFLGAAIGAFLLYRQNNLTKDQLDLSNQAQIDQSRSIAQFAVSRLLGRVDIAATEVSARLGNDNPAYDPQFPGWGDSDLMLLSNVQYTLRSSSDRKSIALLFEEMQVVEARLMMGRSNNETYFKEDFMSVIYSLILIKSALGKMLTFCRFETNSVGDLFDNIENAELTVKRWNIALDKPSLIGSRRDMLRRWLERRLSKPARKNWFTPTAPPTRPSQAS